MSSYILHIFEDDNNFNLIWSGYDKDGTWIPGSYSVDAGPLQQAALAVREQLRILAFLKDQGTMDKFAMQLRNLAIRGQELFLQLMPAQDSHVASEIQQRLEHVTSTSSVERPNLIVNLGTERLFVPWGFVFSREIDNVPELPSLSLQDLKGFWLSEFNISVVYGGTRAMPPARKSQYCRLLALHENMFVGAKNSLTKESLERLDMILDGDPTPAMDWDSFEVSWNQVRDDHDSVLYLFGHSDGKRIQLRDEAKDLGDDPKYDLLVSSLKRFRKKARDSASIFILNGCRTAAPERGPTEEPISANFLKETRQPGYYGFIGTEAQVSNTFACRYGTEFLWRLCKQGKSVGETYDELLNLQDLFPQNLLYTCYADRDFRFAAASKAGDN
jgi:hypothetical protein